MNYVADYRSSRRLLAACIDPSGSNHIDAVLSSINPRTPITIHLEIYDGDKDYCVTNAQFGRPIRSGKLMRYNDPTVLAYIAINTNLSDVHRSASPRAFTFDDFDFQQIKKYLYDKLVN